MELRGTVLAKCAQDPVCRHWYHHSAAAATTTVTTMLLAYKQKSKTSNNNNRLLLYAVNKELILKIFTMPM